MSGKYKNFSADILSLHIMLLCILVKNIFINKDFVTL